MVYPMMHILQKFQLLGQQFTCTPITVGLINDTFLVADEMGRRYILQKINHRVFERVDVLMDNIARALPFLKGEDYTQLTFVPTRTKKWYYQQNGEYWRMMTYIEDSITYNTTSNGDIAFEAGRIIGKFHSLLQQTDIAHYHDTLPKFHSLDHRKEEFQLALKNSDVQKRKTASIAIDKAKALLKALSQMNTSQLRTRICHNDTKLNNMLYSKRTHKALCLIDLDTLMEGYFYYDFGDAIRTIVNSAPEDETDVSKITFNETLLHQFIDGLATHPAFLTADEMKSLPMGMVFMPFMHGLRALTDYLNGNRYYKVDYPTQNLDRSLSLFCFAEKALNQKSATENYLKKHLNAID